MQSLRGYHAELGVPDNYAELCGLPVCPVPEELVETEPDYYGRPQRLIPAAFGAWSAMKTAAAAEGITLHLISGFRAPEYQFDLIRKKLESGQHIGEILKVNAAPGFSEHHSGRAIDVGTLGCAALVEEFELTPAFNWLTEHANSYGFRLSYPRGNRFGIAYEPWHWCFQGEEGGP